jgi:hypothetical protein
MNELKDLLRWLWLLAIVRGAVAFLIALLVLIIVAIYRL